MRNKNIKVFILSEGGDGIGFGHISRCVSLYQAFEHFGVKPVFIINGDRTIRRLASNIKLSLFDWLKNRKTLFSLIKNSDIAIGHCCPKYNLESLDKEMLQQMVNRTIPKPKIAILDWKGIGGEKQRLISLCEELGLEVKKTKNY